MRKQARTKLAAYLAIPAPLSGEGEFASVLYEVLDRVCSLSQKLEFKFEDFGSYYPTIDLVEISGVSKRQISEILPSVDLKTHEILKISLDVPFPQSRLDWVSDEHLKSPRRLNSIYRALINNIFSQRICDLFVIANLAQPGSLELGHSCLFQDGHETSGLQEISAFNLRMAGRDAKRIGWPSLRTLKLEQAWAWVLHQRGFLEGFGDSPTGRALNAFSHLLEETDSPLGLFWAIVGIEALYVRGKVALMEQVREKSQLLLGEQTSFKKKISQMYSFRSAFVHGSLNFPGFRLLHDGTPEVEKHYSDLMESSNTAVAVLTATLQELVARDWNGLHFSYMIKETD